MTEKPLCRACGGPLTAPATGRPPRYCSTGCRRAIEARIRRLDRHAATLLEKVSEQRSLAADAPGEIRRHRLELVAEEFQAQLDAVERELVDLYRSTEGDPPVRGTVALDRHGDVIDIIEKKAKR